MQYRLRQTGGVRRRMIDARRAAREGKRFYAFYRGVRDARLGRAVNPFPSGGDESLDWANGRKYAEDSP